VGQSDREPPATPKLIIRVRELEASKHEVQTLRRQIASLNRSQLPSGSIGGALAPPSTRPERYAIDDTERRIQDGFGQPKGRRFAQGNGAEDRQKLDGFGRPLTIGQTEVRKRPRLDGDNE